MEQIGTAVLVVIVEYEEGVTAVYPFWEPEPEFNPREFGIMMGLARDSHAFNVRVYDYRD
jgi:hypothetical protein